MTLRNRRTKVKQGNRKEQGIKTTIPIRYRSGKWATGFKNEAEIPEKNKG